jgi:hypothetical protein
VVVVDTTTTKTDPTISSVRWIQLLSLSALGRVRLIVPEVVVRETLRHREREAAVVAAGVAAQRDKLARTLKKASELEMAVDMRAPAAATADPRTADASQRLRQKLAEVDAEIAPLPEVSHEELLDRDLAEGKPFTSTGKGYRDALVWHTLREVASAVPGTVFFVTANTNDFCEDAARLHPDLVAQLGHAAGRIRWIRDLETLLQQPELAVFVGELARTPEELAEYIADADEDEFNERTPVAELIERAVVSAAEDLAGEPACTPASDEYGIDFTGFDLPEGLTDAHVDLVEPDYPGAIDWQTYETYEGETLLVVATVIAAVRLTATVHRGDFAALDHHAIEVLDWTGGSAAVAAAIDARLQFQVRVEAGAGVVGDIEFEAAEPS